MTTYHDDDIPADHDIHDGTESRLLPPGSTPRIGDIIPATATRCALRIVDVSEPVAMGVWVRAIEEASR